MVDENRRDDMKQPFKKKWFKASEYHSNFIPKGAEVFIGVDYGSPDGDYTVKGFYDPSTGVFHIIEVGNEKEL